MCQNTGQFKILVRWLTMIIYYQSVIIFRPDNYDEGWYQDETTGEWYNQFDWIQDEASGEWYYEDR